jgi:hypothetical protein
MGGGGFKPPPALGDVLDHPNPRAILVAHMSMGTATGLVLSVEQLTNATRYQDSGVVRLPPPDWHRLMPAPAV